MALNHHIRSALAFMLIILSVSFTVPRMSDPGKISAPSDFSELLKVEPLLPEMPISYLEFFVIQIPEKIKAIPLLMDSSTFESSLTCVLLKSQKISLPPPRLTA